jgi:two-component system sensor histidine kinase KdpD
VAVTGTVLATWIKTMAGTESYTCLLSDGTGKVGLLFVGRRQVPGLVVGARCQVEGTARPDGDLLMLWNPLFEVEAPLPTAAPADVAEAVPAVRPAVGPGAVVAAPVPVSAASPGEDEADQVDDGSDVVEASGHFRIYLGAAPGVGKTLAMLDEAHRRAQRGADVVIAIVESHGRPITTARMEGLETVPLKRVEYRGVQFAEMDLPAVLARHPKVALVDELAHTNVPGSGTHEKRWQDVLELLEAGVDVITTVNIQHLESIADAVERIVGAAVGERVPDWVVRRADQIELVDSSPEQLRRRMLHGNIYPPEKVPQALTHFFKADNLTALRELALRFLADETEEELLEHLLQHQTRVLWETTERVMVAVTTAPGTDPIVRRASRMASRLKAELHVVHVATGENARRPDGERLEELRRLVSDVGAHWHELEAEDTAEALVEFALANQITQIVLGSSHRSRWQELTKGGSIVRKVSRRAATAEVDVHIIARRGSPAS